MTQRMVTKAYTLLPYHIATIKQTAKDNGQSSDSAALRFIIDDWVRRLAEEANITLQHYRSQAEDAGLRLEELAAG